MEAIAKLNLSEPVAQAPQLRLVTTDDAAPPRLVFQSEAMRNLVARAQQYAVSRATILLTGETGTGKELIAHLVHRASPRASQRFARVSCAALSESLIESELFGHERGAFAGAERAREGRFEWAAGGTLLLDEVGELPLPLQAKLLRLLEEQEFQRVGSNDTRVANVRVIASTNRDLHSAVDAGVFRSDLLYRLSVLPLHVPALRDRYEDIRPLAEHFVASYQDESQHELHGITETTLELLQAHAWPGNVRELRNAMHHACVVAQHEVIQPVDLPSVSSSSFNVVQSTTCMTLEEVERSVILESLRNANGNKTMVAERLGVTTRTLRNKMHAYRQQGHVTE